MVKIQHLPRAIHITLLPNRSLTWRQTLLVMSVFGSFCLSIALIWAFVGAWLILPFAGLEVGLLVVIMYLVSKRSYQKQILIINKEFVSFHSARDQSQQPALFQRQRVCLLTYQVYHPEDVKELYLVEGKAKQRIGEFLNLEDQKELLEHFAKLHLYPKEIKHLVKIEV